MAKTWLLLLFLWLVLFLIRIGQTGGLSNTFQEKTTPPLQGLQDTLSEKVQSLLPYPQSSLLQGILLGQQKSLPFYLKNSLQQTSTIHMVVVSGQNLSILAGFIMSLASFLGRKKTIAITFLAIIFYSVLTGLQVPVIRAALMAVLSYGAQLLGRERIGWWVLALTAAVMLLFNPSWILSISFQLSFLATLAVVVVAPLLLPYLQKIPQLLRQDLAVTVAAYALTLPVIAYNFQQISLVGILANLFTLWTMPIIMIWGIISLFLGFLNLLAGQIAAFVPSILLTYFIDIVTLFANLPLSSLQIGETQILTWAGYYLTVLAFLWAAVKKGRLG